VSIDIFDDFAPEPGGMGSGSARVGDILARGVALRWDEAVALLQEVLEAVTSAEGTNALFPAFEDVVIDREGAVAILSTRRGERGPVAAGRALHALLATADVPLPLRLFVTQANAPETHDSLQAFGEALAYFGKPGRSDLIRAIYARYRSTAPTAAPTVPGRPAAPPPLPPNAARREHAPELRRGLPAWLVPAAVAVCVVSVAAVIWFGLIGGGNSAAASTTTEAKAAAAEAPATTKDAKKPAPKATAVGRAPAEAAGGQQSAAAERAGRRDVASDSSAPLFDPSTIRLSEPPLRVAQVPEGPDTETTKATIPLVPASSEYVVAPRENTAATIYSSADADVQPPVMLYPSLPPTVFVARNADVTVINRMELVIAPDGTVERVRLVNGPTRMPDMMLLSGAKLWRFTPAVKDGTPVRYRAIVTWTGFP
jgi:hypothetical protein